MNEHFEIVIERIIRAEGVGAIHKEDFAGNKCDRLAAFGGLQRLALP